MNGITLGSRDIGIDDVVAVARHGAGVALDASALVRMNAGRAVVDRYSAENIPAYGVTRGLGGRVVNEITPQERADYSRVVVLARACGGGEPLPREAVRAAQFARAASMARGGAGVRPLIVETQCAMLAAGVHPYVPSIGSVGASDLALCANLALPLIGEGRAEYGGDLIAGAEAMTRAGIAPVVLAEKEGLALCSANSISVGLGALLLADLSELMELLDGIVVLTMEGFRANPSPIDPRVVRARGAPGQARAAQSMREKLAGSALFDEGEPRRVQDPISIRCASHVHGSLRATIDFCTPNVEVELNGAGDNPLVVAEDDIILSNGNFHTPAMAVAFDALALAMAQTAVMSSQRTARLLQAAMTDLPDRLSHHGPTHAGLGLLSHTADTLAKDIHILCQPASIFDSSGYNVEDHAPMTPLAVRKATQILGHLRQVAACELMVAAQALDMRDLKRCSPVARALRDRVREIVAPLDDDRSFTFDVIATGELIAGGSLMACLQAGS